MHPITCFPRSCHPCWRFFLYAGSTPPRGRTSRSPRRDSLSIYLQLLTHRVACISRYLQKEPFRSGKIEKWSCEFRSDRSFEHTHARLIDSPRVSRSQPRALRARSSFEGSGRPRGAMKGSGRVSSVPRAELLIIAPGSHLPFTFLFFFSFLPPLFFSRRASVRTFGGGRKEC